MASGYGCRSRGCDARAAVAIPAYGAMQDDEGLRQRLLSILMRGVSTRNYQEVVPEMADRCGVSRSAVSRQLQQASAEALRSLCERRFEEVELLAAWKLEPKEGMARLGRQIEWLERTHPKAAASLREGLEETFTINRLGLSPMLRKCLATTNVIESSLSGAEGRTGRVTRWRSGEMALRWAAAAALETEKNFRKIIGFRDMWMLKAALDHDQTLDEKTVSAVDEERLAA